MPVPLAETGLEDYRRANSLLSSISYYQLILSSPFHFNSSLLVPWMDTFAFALMLAMAGGMRYIKREFDLDADPTLEGLIVSMTVMTRPTIGAHQEPNTEPIIRRSLRSKRRPWKLRELEEI